MDRKRSSTDFPADESPQKMLKNEDKYGSSGMQVTLTSNYFKLLEQPEFQLTQYRVDFMPDIDVTNTRKKMIGENRQHFGRYIFDGASLYLTKQIEDQVIETQYDAKPLKISIRRTGEIKNTDPTAFQLFNLIFRDAMAGLKLQNIRRDYFDAEAKIDVPKGNLELWPGYLTSIRAHEDDVLLCTEISHKFMRKETAMDITKRCMNEGSDWKEKVKRELLTTTVLTAYTNKTYQIDDIDFTKTPKSTFKPSYKEDEISYIDYYKTRYGIDIKDDRQFMLVSKSKERDLRAGKPELIHLVPELCRATGMTDAMRADFKLMQDLSTYTRLNPENRKKALVRFNNRIQSNTQSMTVLKEWKMELDKELVKIPGRELPPEPIIFGGHIEDIANAKGEWVFRNHTPMYMSRPIIRWVMMFPKSLKVDAENFLEKLKGACKEMSCEIKDPVMRELADDKQDTFICSIRELAEKKPKMFLIVLPTNRADRYSAVKKCCLVELGIPAQVIVKRTINNKNIGSIASKVAIQMSAKLGALPWMIKLPVKGLMTVGFDVSHHPRDKSRSIGALVATMNLLKTGTFYSITASYQNGNEMNVGLAQHMKKALDIYKEESGCLPEKILFYRDGVGEGQIEYVKKQEVGPLIAKLREIYGDDDPKLAYIIVNKRINTRLFKSVGSSMNNPKPGTVVDRVITMPDRDDFFLVSQHVGQGTVSPTSYNIVYNSSGLNKDRLEILTYKFTHLYFNWSGTTRIPAVSQYAKKLAFLSSQSLQGAPVNKNLEKSLYFL